MRLSTRIERALRKQRHAVSAVRIPPLAEDLRQGARIALEEWLRRYARPDVTDPIGLVDDLLHELDVP